MAGRNIEKYDIGEIDEAPMELILSKHFLRPIETPESQLAYLIDSGKKFNYNDTLFYKVRSRRLSHNDPVFSRLPKGVEWWDMPWLREKDGQSPRHFKVRGEKFMRRIFNDFKHLFESIKNNGFVAKNVKDFIRADRITQGDNKCYIYVDANKRMGIFAYLIRSKQMSLDSLPVRIARAANSHQCGWMDTKTSRRLFNHPFVVLEETKNDNVRHYQL